MISLLLCWISRVPHWRRETVPALFPDNTRPSPEKGGSPIAILVIASPNAGSSKLRALQAISGGGRDRPANSASGGRGRKERRQRIRYAARRASGRSFCPRGRRPPPQSLPA